MASIPLTLAALATSAVPGMLVHGSREHHGGGDGDFLSAVVTGEIVSDATGVDASASEADAAEDAGEGTGRGGTIVECIVRVPRSPAAEVRQSAELLGLAALTEGARTRLPFAVPEVLGLTRAGETRAVVSTFLEGMRFEAEDLEEDALLLQPIAEAIAAIHHLPQSIAQSGGLPVRSSVDLRLEATRLVDRAAATRLLPETVHRRWEEVLGQAELWDFAPTMTHGGLDAEQLLVADDRVVGVLGWSEFSVGDPATDLAWLLAAGSDVFDAVLARYTKERGAGAARELRIRAQLYHELAVARWLVHGSETHDETVTDDAVAMLDRLVSRPSLLTGVRSARAPLGEAEVSAMLEETPEVVDRLSDTAAYEALDEDRMFGFETGFVAPLDAGEEDGAGDGSDAGEGSPGSAADADATARSEGSGADAGGAGAEDREASRLEALSEQETQPIDPLDDVPEAPNGSGTSSTGS